MSPRIAVPKAVLLLVGREEFTPPTTFAGSACAASHDCLAVGVRGEHDGPTVAMVAPTADGAGLTSIGEFALESEGQLSLRDVFNREYDAMGVDPGTVRVSVMANDETEPSEVVFVVSPV